MEPDFKPCVRAFVGGCAVSEQEFVRSGVKDETRARVLRVSFGIGEPERDDINIARQLSC